MKITELTAHEFNTLFSPEAILDAALRRGDKYAMHKKLATTGKEVQKSQVDKPVVTTNTCRRGDAVHTGVLFLSSEGMSIKHIARVFNLRISAVSNIVRAEMRAKRDANEY